jgi:NAD(P)-dependent dehydrogenase (short-subunit alcohol dehydrogenase family)
MYDFKDRHIVVTGGTGALGTAVVGALVKAGAFCHVPYHINEEAERFPYRANPRVKLIGDANIASDMVVRRVYESVPKLWASIHLAGGFAMGPIAESDEAELMGMLRTNLVTCILCCAAAVRAIRKAGGGGRIVNIAARNALEPRLGANAVAYTASKAGVAALTQALAEEVAAEGILVNAIAPSIMDTPANRAAMPKANHAAWPTVEDVAGTILYLASPEDRVTRGAVVPVYGRS